MRKSSNHSSPLRQDSDPRRVSPKPASKSNQPHVDFPKESLKINSPSTSSSKYQNLVTSLFYSQFNPDLAANFPNSNVNPVDFDDEDAPTYDAPTTTVKLQGAAENNTIIRNKLVDYINTQVSKIDKELDTPQNDNIQFVCVDLSLPATQKAMNKLKMEDTMREKADIKLEEAKEKRIQNIKAKNELIKQQRENILKEEAEKRRENYLKKEAEMKPAERRKLEKVREELRNPKKYRNSADKQTIEATSNQQETTNETSPTRKFKDYKELQKMQKEKFLQNKKNGNLPHQKSEFPNLDWL